MVNPEFIEEAQMSLTDVKIALQKIEKKDPELNYRSNKAREYLDQVANLSNKEADEIKSKLEGLNLTRLKLEHIIKIIDFMPKSVDELKVVLQAYPLSMPKKDQEAIIGALKA